VVDNGWEYERLDDAFFDFAPVWARRRCAGNIYALTDICRLQWLRMQLHRGYERVIWADADILIFSSVRLDVTTRNGHAFARELFLSTDREGQVKAIEGINNALMVFERNQSVLDTYLTACLERLRSLPAGPVPRTELGPELLADMANNKPLDTMNGIGLFTPAIMRQIAFGGGPLTMLSDKLPPGPLGAANLCHFLRNVAAPVQRSSFDALYDRAVSILIRTGGKVLSQQEQWCKGNNDCQVHSAALPGRTVDLKPISFFSNLTLSDQEDPV